MTPFQPLVADWFAARFGEPTPPQAAGWREIASGRHTLIAAPTGSGKTLAAFLWSINGLVEQALSGTLEDRTAVVYVSPLKALSNDIEKNLQEPLRGIANRAAAQGVPLPEIRVAVRTGDTAARDRARMLRQPPHILITTPESLFILLTAAGSRRFLSGARTVIVDEIHASAGDKRGSHLALSLERLDALNGTPLQRIGLSATQKPIEDVARLLVGMTGAGAEAPPACAIVDVGHRRALDLTIEVPDQELGPIATHELWAEIYDRVVAQVQAHRATLVFVNTRRQAERVAHELSERLGTERVATHHGSLARATRLRAEERLKRGEAAVVVATASLELGIDIGHVDLVCHIGAPRQLATLLQRVGRSGHWLGAVPKGILYPLTRDELVQCAAALRAVRAGELDRLLIPEAPLDILAQQIVAVAATGEIGEEELWHLVRRAYPFRRLAREQFDAVVEILSEGIATGRGRRLAYLHRDRVQGHLRGRRGARLAAITSGGAIPDVADYDVIEEPAGTFVGKVNEDFAVESMAGDIFLLGNQSWRIRRVESGRLRVEDAKGAPPNVPFWLGEAPARTREMSEAVSGLRECVASRLGDRDAAVAWLQEESAVTRAGAEQMADYIAATVRMLGAVPSVRTVVAERFFDESGGMQLVLHTPFGGRINRALGLTMRKRFCLTFDFELQAAATDDGVVLSLGEQHSFPLDSAFSMIRLATLREDLVQAMLVSPMFTNRWRWNATRALAILRREGGRKVPMPLQRMRADDLLAAVFPGQVACQDNHAGPIEPPDHPLVNETILNCLHEAMDLDGLRDVVDAIGSGEIRTVTVDTPAPSPMSHEILNANPYAFLDDAPLEERRARAVSLRRLDDGLAGGIGALDAEAIAAVAAQAWPDLRNADELHDFLLTVGLLRLDDAEPWRVYVDELCETRRAAVASWRRGDIQARALVAAERLPAVQAVLGQVDLEPRVSVPPGVGRPSERDAMEAMVQGWLEALGPVSVGALAERSSLPPSLVEIALAGLEGRGVVLRGRFTPASGPNEVEWCERRLLARIHRLTLGRLRREIEPVTAADFIRFLLRWQHVAPGTQLHAREGLLEVVRQLQGVELPAPAWEQSVLPARVARYDAADLEQLCLAGVVAWGRLSRYEVQGSRFEVQSSGQVSAYQVQGLRLEVQGSKQFLPSASNRRPSTSNLEGRSPKPRRLTSHLAPPTSNLAPPTSHLRSRTSNLRPSRQAPLAFVLREDLASFLDDQQGTWSSAGGLSREASAVAAHLEQRGASFITDLARGTGLMAVAVEEALWELVARGLVTGDGIAGLRVLLQPQHKRRAAGGRLRLIRGGRLAPRVMPVGRWALWGGDASDMAPELKVEARAWQFLRRYGVVFRDLLAREAQAPPWRVLLGIYRRLEARGEIRGGRFVEGFIGEQYALPGAVEALRAVRRMPLSAEPVLVSSSDPLNLVGILTPGPRVSPFSKQVIAFRDGVPVDVGPLGAVRSRLHAASAGSASL